MLIKYKSIAAQQKGMSFKMHLDPRVQKMYLSGHYG